MQLYIVLNFVIVINHLRQKIRGEDDLKTVLKKELLRTSYIKYHEQVLYGNYLVICNAKIAIYTCIFQ